MKPGHWMIFGSAFAGCAAALGIYLAAKGHSSGVSAPPAGAERCEPSKNSKRHVCTTAKPESARTTAKTASQTMTSDSSAGESRHKSGEPSPEFRIHGKPPTGRVTDERAWFANAERVQREANRELQKLRETLELSPNQQQRIFDVYAQNSPSWQPGMLTGGAYGVGLVGDAAKPSDNSNLISSESAWQAVENSSAVGNPDGEAAPAIAMADEIMTILDADQQQALVEEEINRRAWWEEILPQLLTPELPSASGADDPAASLIGGGDTKAYEGPTGLLEE